MFEEHTAFLELLLKLSLKYICHLKKIKVEDGKSLLVLHEENLRLMSIAKLSHSRAAPTVSFTLLN